MLEKAPLTASNVAAIYLSVRLYEVAKALDITIEEFLTGEGPEPMVKEVFEGYGLTQRESEYTKKLVTIFRKKDDGTIAAITQNIDTFLRVPDREEEKKIRLWLVK